MSRSRSARLAGWLGPLALLAMALGCTLALLDWLSGFVGFRIFALGIVLGVLSLLLGLLGLLMTTGRGNTDRSKALRGLVCGIVTVLVLGATAGRNLSLPPINDISTDLVDPPTFMALALEAANAERDMSYPGEQFAVEQRKAYPDLATLQSAKTPQVLFQDTMAAAKALGWTVHASDEANGRLEATEASKVFRFIDDIVVRIRPSGSGSELDIRSKSRDGKGDVGANAARIRRFFAELI